MLQIGLFPLSDEELMAKAKGLAGKIDEHDTLAEEKDTVSREYNERLKKLAGEIRQLAKEIRTEKEERQASDEEAPWQGLIDQAEEVARGRRRKTRRDVDAPDGDLRGDVEIEEEEGP
jgi:hypothetical protein